MVVPAPENPPPPDPLPDDPPPLELIPAGDALTAAAVAVEVGVATPPPIAALREKFTVAPGGTSIGTSKVNTLVPSGGATVADSFCSPIVAVSVSEVRSDGLLTVRVTLCSSSVNSFELV